MIDTDGFRLNVGIILVNSLNQVFWAKRIGLNAWQFPQGGMKLGETPEQAMYRELKEEIGLDPEDIQILSCTKEWLYYKLPKHLVRHYTKPLCIGQKQQWFLLKLITDETRISFNYSEHPEFEDWRWVNYWHPLTEIVDFKKPVYEAALKELAVCLGESIAC